MIYSHGADRIRNVEIKKALNILSIMKKLCFKEIPALKHFKFNVLNG